MSLMSTPSTVRCIDTCFEYHGTFVEFFFRYALWITVAELLIFRYMLLEYLHWIGIGNIARLLIPAKAN
jgi:hypothetical protein